MGAPLRVLVLNERDPLHPRAGGAEVQLAELSPRLADRGFALTQAACRFAGAPARDAVEGLRVWRLGSLPSYYPRAAWLCARETRRGRFDVVLDVLAKFPFCAPLYSASPVLALCHHLFGRTAFLQVPWPVAAAVCSAERLLPLAYRGTPFAAVSESTKQELVARGIPAGRIRVIHSGTRPRALPAAGSGAPPRRVAYLGRLEPYKQIDVMLRAMGRLAARFPDAEVLVIGRGRERARLERVAAAAGIAARTRFTGFVSDEERDALLAGCRVCVCPSQKEGWGLTVLEANALGVPVVATDAPGLRDSVRDGVTGFLAPDRDVDAFAARIARLLEDAELARRMSREALAWSRTFDWDRTADELAEALEAARRAG